MQLAVDCAGFSAAEADQLRRAMGSKRSTERMRRLRGRFYDGMRERHGITGEVADRIYEKLEAFANFGFPESHSLSFASLVFYSSWFKLHHPAAFCAALLRAQPMGFYSPQSLVADARRHGVTVHGPDVNASLAHATLENGGTEVRLGLGSVRHIGDELAERIVEERKAHGRVRFSAGSDRPGAAVACRRPRRWPPPVRWAASGSPAAKGCGPRARPPPQRPDRLPGVGSSSHIPSLPGMTELELAAADVWATGVSSGQLSHPVPARGPRRARRRSRRPAAGGARRDPGAGGGGGDAPAAARDGAGRDVHQPRGRDRDGQRPVLAGSVGRHRKLAQTASALLIRGQVQNATGAVTVVADRMGKLDMTVASRSRDFR